MRFVDEQSQEELMASIESKIGKLVYSNDDVTVQRIEPAVDGWWPLRVTGLDTRKQHTVSSYITTARGQW